MGLHKKYLLKTIVLAIIVLVSAQVLSTPHASAASCANVQTSIIDCGTYDDNAKDGGGWALLLTITNFLSVGVGMVIVASIIFGGITMTTARANPEQFAKGRSRIISALIGLLIFVFGAAFLQYILPNGMLNPNDSLANQEQISDTPSPSAAAATAPNADWSIPQTTGPTESKPPADPSKVETYKAKQVLIIGDSITQRPVSHTNHGSEGWWEYILAGHDGKFKFSAVGGTGYLRRGGDNNLPTFGMRLGDVDKYKPRAIIIAGGVNDRGYSDSQLKAAISSYYNKLNKLIAKYNIPKDNVYAIVPHPKGTTQNVSVVIQDNANRIGIQWIGIDGYTSTYDGLHPDSRGAKTISDSFKEKSDFDEKLK